jgi:hypothetical protein
LHDWRAGRTECQNGAANEQLTGRRIDAAARDQHAGKDKTTGDAQPTGDDEHAVGNTIGDRRVAADVDNMWITAAHSGVDRQKKTRGVGD